MDMLGLDVIGVDENVIIDTAAQAGKGIAKAFKKDDKTPTPDAGKAGPKPPEEPFYEKLIVGPVRVWHAAVGALVLGGTIVLWPRRR